MQFEKLQKHEPADLEAKKKKKISIIIGASGVPVVVSVHNLTHKNMK